MAVDQAIDLAVIVAVDRLGRVELPPRGQHHDVECGAALAHHLRDADDFDLTNFAIPAFSDHGCLGRMLKSCGADGDAVLETDEHVTVHSVNPETTPLGGGTATVGCDAGGC